MKQCKEINQNRVGTENFDIYFCVIYGRYYQSFNHGREAGYWASPPNFKVFKIFPKFLRSNS